MIKMVQAVRFMKRLYAPSGVLASAYSDRDLLQARESSLNSPLKPFDLKIMSQVPKVFYCIRIFLFQKTSSIWQTKSAT
jgi:hypothetical protein